MEIRSKVKDKDYFDKYIEVLQEIIEESYSDLRSQSVQPNQIKSFTGNIYTSHIKLFVAKYSAGYPIDSIRLVLERAIALLEETWSYPTGQNVAAFYWDTYPELLWMLSTAYCLGMKAHEIDPIIKIVNNAAGHDWLVDFLLSNFGNHVVIHSSLVFPKPYTSLKKAVDESDPLKRSAIVKHYLEKEWYPGHKGVYWYDKHKSRHDTFFGYWSFESAAVVKIAGIDDSSFRDNMYYPKDLL
jgi:hypothetical protein